MAGEEPTTIKGGKVKVLIGNDATPIVYTSQCGFNQRSVKLNKGLEEVSLPNCLDPDAVNWVGRDAVSLSMTVDGEGLLAQESVDTWLLALEDPDSVPVKVVWEFPAKTITWTGKMHVESFEAGAQDGRRVTSNVTLQSDGKMTRVTTP